MTDSAPLRVAQSWRSFGSGSGAPLFLGVPEGWTADTIG